MAELATSDDWSPLLMDAARRFGTPSYVVRWRPVAAAVERLERELMSPRRLRCWLSFKTHPVPPLLERWLQTGRGVEVVSESEFVTALKAGASVDGLLVNGVAKHAWLPRYHVPRLQVHFDSIQELERLIPQAIAHSWRVGIRCHAPDECDARTPCFGGPFGMTAAEAVHALRLLARAGTDVRGLHFHVGQRPKHSDAYSRAVTHLAELCADAQFEPRYVDLGGGLPAPTHAAPALDALRRAIEVAATVFPSLQEVWLEHGRFVSETSTALAVRVLDIKVPRDCRYLICDGGRTNHALAADRGMHPLLVLPPRNGPLTLTTICGPTCMTDDVLGRLQLPGDIAVGDVIAWMNAGAYHLPWETRFSHGLCAVVWADANDRLTLARPREEPDMWSHSWISNAA